MKYTNGLGFLLLAASTAHIGSSYVNSACFVVTRIADAPKNRVKWKTVIRCGDP